MLRSPIKKLVAAILAAALLLTMAMPSAALAAPSPTEAGQAKSYEGNASVPEKAMTGPLFPRVRPSPPRTMTHLPLPAIPMSG